MEKHIVRMIYRRSSRPMVTVVGTGTVNYTVITTDQHG